jgi:hypothetical protein
MIPISPATPSPSFGVASTPASTVQCDFADRELASSRATGLRRSLMGAAVVSGEVAAPEQSVGS